MSTVFTRFFFLLLLVTGSATAQYIQVNDTFTPQQLVEALVGGSCTQVSNISLTGNIVASAPKSYGQFNAAGTVVPFESGIMLTTGTAKSGEGPNDAGIIIGEGGESWPGDADLEAALNMSNTFNATVLEFDFIPVGTNINFNYIFASEEYIQMLNPNACGYTDGFAFLLKEAGSSAPYQNLAVLPDTTIPVMITTVRGAGSCDAANEEYFDAYNPNEYATSYNGQTVVLTAYADVTPGTTYHIKLVIADHRDTVFDSAVFLQAGSFTTITSLGPDRLVATGNPVCNGGSLTVDATTQGATGYQWYKNTVAVAGETNATYTITAPGDYTVGVQLGNCTAEGGIVVEYAPPLPTTAVIEQCDDNGDGLTVYNLEDIASAATAGLDGWEATGYYLTQAAANAGTPQINTTAPFSNTTAGQQIYVGIKSPYGCLGIVTVTLSTPATSVAAVTPLEACDTDGIDDGLFTFNLTATQAAILAGAPAGAEVAFYTSYYNALAQVAPIAVSSYTNTVAGGQTLYARVSNGPDCVGITPIQVVVYYFGTLQDEEVYLCDAQPIVLSAPLGMDAYDWQTPNAQTTQNITVTQPGDYTVNLVSADGCSGSKTWHVLQSGRAKGAGYVINDFMGGDNSLAITPTGPGVYEYSLDGIHYQDAPFFENLAAGEYLLRIRDKNGCGPDFTDKIYILDYNKFFTPNEDGTNDTWRINNLRTRPQLLVYVYDRFGKLIVSFRGDNGWDGTLNGKPLPSTDYWFSIALENGRVVKGHFSLLR